VLVICLRLVAEGGIHYWDGCCEVVLAVPTS
jgi:hypothetical protein